MKHIVDPAEFQRQVRSFWEGRGCSAETGHAVTMLAGHKRFLDYVHRAELRFISRRLPISRPRILDLGCGTGRLSIALAGAASEVVGLELAESLVKRAREDAALKGCLNVKFLQGQLGDRLPEQGYDLVVLSGVLNCVDDDTVRRGLDQAARSLVAGGVLYLRNNCSNRRTFFRPGSATEPPCIYRTGQDYRGFVQATPGLQVVEDRLLFPPFCLPNSVYYHLLPRSIREKPPIRRLLDLWFHLEELTAEDRIRHLGALYQLLLKVSRKPTSFRVIVATRDGY
jgi:SAM-dependent methyltransferase